MICHCLSKYFPVYQRWNPQPYYHPYHECYDAPYYPCCPVCHNPYHLCCCPTEFLWKLPQELSVDTASSPKETFVGGIKDVRLTLEYTPTDPTTNSIKITIDGSGGTTTWDATNVSDGYYVKDDFAPVAPGSKVIVGVNNCMARLRWCEVIAC